MENNSTGTTTVSVWPERRGRICEILALFALVYLAISLHSFQHDGWSAFLDSATAAFLLPVGLLVFIPPGITFLSNMEIFVPTLTVGWGLYLGLALGHVFGRRKRLVSIPLLVLALLLLLNAYGCARQLGELRNF